MPYHPIHPDNGMNFQFNRVVGYGDRACDFEEVRSIAGNIDSTEDWYQQWKRIGETAESEKRYMHAAYYQRMSEFFLSDTDPEKVRIYNSFKKNFERGSSQEKIERLEIPYQGKFLPAIRMKAENEKETLIMHGGYDSFMEEFYFSLHYIVEQGYSIILFEGPGQGAPQKAGLKFTHEWEKPVAAVLDFLDLRQVSIVGISWGGYLALRAAAYDKRITKAVAWDICFDGLEVMTYQMPIPIRQIVRYLFRSGKRGAIDGLAERIRRKNMLYNWAISHGMYITGTKSPFDFYEAISKHTMKDISHLVDQDVLLLAGEKDHLIPLNHLKKQKRALTAAKSVTSHLFTQAEGGEQHCQVGEIKLAQDKIVEWLDRFHG